MGTTVDAPSDYGAYQCGSVLYPDEWGAEVLYSVTISQTTDLTVTLLTWSPLSEDGDPDIFILEAPDWERCLPKGYGDWIVTRSNVPPGTYYFTVDGWRGWQGEYTLDVQWEMPAEAWRLFLPIVIR